MAGTAFSTGNWTGYVEHAADITEGSSALTAFSLLIDIAEIVADSGSGGWGDEVQSDGADIRCTDEDDNELPFDLIDWSYTDADTITGLIRVKRSLSASDSTEKVRIWGGYTGGTAVAYSASETYGSDNAYDSDWVGYWPLHDVNDRTSGGNNLTERGGITAGGATGKIGGATEFDAVGEYFELPVNGTSWSDGDFTAMVWVNADSTSDMALLGIEENSDLQWWLDQSGSNHRAAAYIPVVYGASSFSSGVWKHMLMRVSGDNAIALFVDGSEDGTNTGFDITTNFTHQIGVSQSVVKQLDGTLCQYQIHNAVRSAEWISHEYDQTNDNDTFWGTWSWTASGGGGISIPAVMHHRRLIGAS